MNNKLLGNQINKVFVTGGAGFIGSHLVEILVDQNYFVTCFDNLSNGKEEYINYNFNNINFKFIKDD